MITHHFKTILGNVPETWQAVQLRRLLISHTSGDWGAEDGDVGVKIIRSTNFTDAGHLDFSDVAVRYFAERNVERFGLTAGDILLERSGGGPDQPVGRVGFVESDLGWFWVSNFVQVLRPDPRQVNSRYLGWALFGRCPAGSWNWRRSDSSYAALFADVLSLRPSATSSTHRSFTPSILRNDFSASRKPAAHQRSAIS